MKQFEYRMHEVAIDAPAITLKELNELGREGWQVVQYFPLGESATVLVMREVGWRRVRAA